MKSKVYDSIDDFGRDLGLSDEQIEISRLKTKLKKRIRKRAAEVGIPISEIAKSCGLGRTSVSGIINGSLQSVSLERLLRLAFALELTVDMRIKVAA